jgi:glycerol-3-phosphate dehydrogenase (NAD(P)+)
MKFAVLGGGAWGTALAQVLSDNGHQVVIFARKRQTAQEINERHTNSAYFGNEIKLPASLKASSDLEAALAEAEAVVLAIPTVSYRSVIQEMVPFLKRKVFLVSVGKGFDPETSMRLSSLIRELVPEEKRYPVVSLIGPSFAEEVIRRSLTLVTSVSLDIQTADTIQVAFSNSYFRVYTNDDEIGAEYASAMKNVIAIASGILTGLGYQDNAHAALLTRGLAEMMRLGTAEGGRVETYLGLTGLGDLTLTCSSLKSRNFTAGMKIGKDNTSSIFLKENKATVEGLKAALVIYNEAKRMKIDMPIVNVVYQILYNDKCPSDAVISLMKRSLKSEF